MGLGPVTHKARTCDSKLGTCNSKFGDLRQEVWGPATHEPKAL